MGDDEKDEIEKKEKEKGTYFSQDKIDAINNLSADDWPDSKIAKALGIDRGSVAEHKKTDIGKEPIEKEEKKEEKIDAKEESEIFRLFGEGKPPVEVIQAGHGVAATEKCWERYKELCEEIPPRFDMGKLKTPIEKLEIQMAEIEKMRDQMEKIEKLETQMNYVTNALRHNMHTMVFHHGDNAHNRCPKCNEFTTLKEGKDGIWRCDRCGKEPFTIED